MFYVVVDDVRGRIKFGITSGDPRPRLRDHARDGFEIVVRLLTGLPETVAPDLERKLIRMLTLAGVEPVRGREYFDRCPAETLILDIVDHYPTSTAVERPAR
ncbi:hypothetical protein [Streptomyces sp. NPDC088775]|uniref:hypothetical protein n=1 Tax=Streptomyces sp. NPDC088775 TaxID=3365896 RepID=UPI0037FD30AD